MGRANLIRVGFHNFTIFEIHFCIVSHDIKHVIKADIIVTRFPWMVKIDPSFNCDWTRFVIDCENRKGLNLIFLLSKNGINLKIT